MSLAKPTAKQSKILQDPKTFKMLPTLADAESGQRPRSTNDHTGNFAAFAAVVKVIFAWKFSNPAHV